jgi:putative beta-barrel porin BBP2
MHPRHGACAILASALFLASQATALDLGAWVPGLKVIPFLTERVEYESNVFQVPHDSQGDVISRTIPGVLVDQTIGPLTLSAGYRVEILRFFDLENQDTEHHIAVGQVRYEAPRLRLQVRDDFTKTSDPPGTEITGRIGSRTNVLAPDGEYRITERFAVDGTYTWTRVDFDEPAASLNRDEHLFGASVSWKVLPKTDLRASYNYGIKKFDDGVRDVTRHLVLVGLRGDITPRFSSTFRIGFELREPRQSQLPGYRGLVFGGDWVYRLTPRTTFTLVLDRSVQESIFANALYFVSTSGTLLAEHQILPKLTVFARATVGENQYPVKTASALNFTRFAYRLDTLVGWAGGIDYDIQRWLRVGAEYAHVMRESNFREFNYADDKITGKITVQF